MSMAQYIFRKKSYAPCALRSSQSSRLKAQSLTNFHKKAQVFSTDIIVAAAIMAIILGLVIFYWNLASTDINKQEQISEIHSAALDTSNYLVKIGLVNFTNTFDSSKLKQLSTCNYTAYKDSIGLSGFDYLVNLSYINGTAIIINNTAVKCGQDFSNSTDLIFARRTGVYNGNEVILNLYVWK